MTINEYQKAALRTERVTGDRTLFIMGRKCGKEMMMEEYLRQKLFVERLVNGLMGLNGEAGEAIDLLKKYLYQGHDLDKAHLAKELGDVAWYIAVSADALGYTLEEILEMNVEKLRKRYPEGFEAERSMNREEGDL